MVIHQRKRSCAATIERRCFCGSQNEAKWKCKRSSFQDVLLIYRIYLVDSVVVSKMFRTLTEQWLATLHFHSMWIIIFWLTFNAFASNPTTIIPFRLFWLNFNWISIPRLTKPLPLRHVYNQLQTIPMILFNQIRQAMIFVSGIKTKTTNAASVLIRNSNNYGQSAVDSQTQITIRSALRASFVSLFFLVRIINHALVRSNNSWLNWV